MTLFLSRVRLAQGSSVQALADILQPKDTSQGMTVAHKLLWSIFADGQDRRRDFVWCEKKDRSFLVLSAREPLQTDLFAAHDTKPFAPNLANGDVLEFSLRVNATRKKRGMKNHVDVVMDALHGLPEDQRKGQRMEIAQVQSAAWLAGQGAKAGFDLLASQCEDYTVHMLDSYRGARKGQPQFGICDITGTLRITDPAAFVAQIGMGFGRAKAFGCGLMLIRRRG